MSQKIIHNIFSYAREQGAVHLVIRRQTNRLALEYFLSGGECRQLSLPKKIEEQFLLSLDQVLSSLADQPDGGKSGRLSGPGQSDYRLEVRPQAGGEKIIINISAGPGPSWPLSRLGLEAADRRLLERAITRRSGLIVLSSLPGQGKSTTLQALLPRLDSRLKNIYFLSRQPRPAVAGINYLLPSPAAWEKLLRHDADIILAEDVDQRSLESALRTAGTGRLVIVTCAASGAAAVLETILNSNLPRRQKIEHLLLIMHQQLAGLRPEIGKGVRSFFGLFEIISLTPSLRRELAEIAAPGKTSRADLAAALQRHSFRPLEFDRRKKQKAGIIL